MNKRKDMNSEIEFNVDRVMALTNKSYGLWLKAGEIRLQNTNITQVELLKILFEEHILKDHIYRQRYCEVKLPIDKL